MGQDRAVSGNQTTPKPNKISHIDIIDDCLGRQPANCKTVYISSILVVASQIIIILQNAEGPQVQILSEAVLFSCRPDRAFKVCSTLRYFPPPKPCQCACDSCARRLVTAASVNDGRTVLRRLQTERSASDADDNRTALYAPPTAQFTELGMSVSLPIYIQSQKYNGRRRTSHFCQFSVESHPSSYSGCRI